MLDLNMVCQGMPCSQLNPACVQNASICTCLAWLELKWTPNGWRCHTVEGGHDAAAFRVGTQPHGC